MKMMTFYLLFIRDIYCIFLYYYSLFIIHTDKMLECMVRDLFGGGLETTEMTLIFSFLILANRPQILKRVSFIYHRSVILTSGNRLYAHDL